MFITPFKFALEDMSEDTLPPPVEDAPLVLPVDGETPVEELPPVEDMDIVPYVEDEVAPTEAMDILPEADMVTVDDELPPDTDVMDELDEDVQGSESLLMEIEHLKNLAVAIETYGISPGMMMVADREGLLASTFIGKIPATESMTGPYKPESVTSQVALEGVMDAIKNKTAEWASKAGSMVKSLASKAGGMIKGAISWAGSFTKSIASKTWDATKAAATTVKAHPYKTAAAAVAALVVIAGIITMIAAMPSQVSEIPAWRTRVTTAMKNLKMPGGKFVAKAPLNARNPTFPEMLKWTKETFPAQPAKLGALGWTKSSLTSIASSMGSALSKVGGAVSKLAGSLPSLIAKAAAMKSAKAAVPAKEAFSKTASYVIGFAIITLLFGWMAALLTGAVVAGIYLVKQNATLAAKAGLS